MARWADFEKDAPEFAARVRAVLDRHKESRGDRIEIPYVTDLYWTARI